MIAEDELSQAIKKGYLAFVRYINSGAVEELNDMRAYIDLSDEEPKQSGNNENQDSNNVSYCNLFKDMCQQSAILNV